MSPHTGGAATASAAASPARMRSALRIMCPLERVRFIVRAGLREVAIFQRWPRLAGPPFRQDTSDARHYAEEMTPGLECAEAGTVDTLIRPAGTRQVPARPVRHSSGTASITGCRGIRVTRPTPT
ncbi:hypothetical protein GORHZ_078_00300 [Gordonia rhizosphera NBRC 16068]|uniref:Uncharacterized protein n=1 Tax=Gordonia rhizosphera NBRC 16068 TaxID=1108045 RepID=K6WTT4_9ACTN|nr:hypothetical protein GORHZ_078_00300 [Gordonia rhizosphera NBRC 16068]